MAATNMQNKSDPNFQLISSQTLVKTENELFHKLFDNANDLIQSIRPDGSFNYVNKKWLETFGYESKELPFINIWQILKKDQIHQCVQILERLKKGEKFEYVETIFQCKDGREIWVEGNLNGYFENNILISTIGIFRDITRRKNLEEAYNTLLKNIPEPIFILQNGKIRFINSSFKAITQFSEEQLLDSDYEKLVYSEDKLVYNKTLNFSDIKYTSIQKEYRLVTQKGDLRWVMEINAFIPFEGTTATLGILFDFTENKRTEEALKKAKNHYQTLFNLSSESIYIIDMQYHFLEINDAACSLLGYSRAEMQKKTLKDLASPRFARIFDQGIKQLIEKGDIIVEGETVRRDGKTIPIEIHSRVVEYENKKAILVVARDISYRKELEFFQKTNENRLESFVKIAQLNFKDTRELLDFTLEELLRLTESKLGYIYFFDDKLNKFSLKSLSKSLFDKPGIQTSILPFSLDKTGILGETVRQRKQMIVNYSQNPDVLKNGYPAGSYNLYKYAAIPIFRNDRVVAVISVANRKEDYDQVDVIQITILMDSVWNLLEQKFIEDERQKAVEQLKESEERYRQIVELSQDGILSLNANGIIITANQAACKMFGYSLKDLIGLSIIETYPLEQQQLAKNRFNNNKLLYKDRIERHAKNKEGKLFPVEISVSPLFNGHIQEIIRDISARKAIENELKKTRDKFLKAFQLNPAMMSIVTLKDGIYLEVNRAFETETGYSRSEVIGRTAREILLLEDPNFNNNFNNLLKDGYLKNIEIGIRTRSGKKLAGMLSMEVIEMDGESASISIIENITERKRMIEQLTNEKNKLQSISDSIEYGLNIIDPEFNILYQNAASNASLGSHLGEKCYQAYSHNAEICNNCAVKLAFKDGKSHIIEREDFLSDGEKHILEISANCIRNSNGEIISCVELVRDVTKRRQAELKLIKSEEFNSNLLNNSPDPIIVINPDTSIKYVNPALVTLTGYSESELIGSKPPFPWFCGENRTKYSSDIDRALAREINHFERQFQRKNGELFWVKASFSVVDFKGKTVYMISTWNDITLNKTMEDSLQRSESNFRNLIENAPVGICVTLPDGKILNVNKTILDLYGYNSEIDFKKEPILNRYVNSEDRSNFLRRLEIDNLVRGFEAPMKKKNGDIFWASSSAMYHKYSDNDCIITIVEDITKRNLAKEELEKANKQLIELDQLKDNFLSTVSHELRTPLTSIKSFAEILLTYDEDRTTQKEFLGIINEESDRLTRLINDFLDLSKIQSGKMQWNLTEVSLYNVVQAVSNTFKPLVEKNKLKLFINLEPDLPQVISDKDKLFQVLTNLLGNATKFTPEGGEIVLKAAFNPQKVTSDNRNMVIVSIKDSGIGIAPEHHNSIFQKFGQVGDVLKDRPKGTGLGLPICKKIVEHFGGTIWVESALGHGSTFYFTLPVSGKNSSPDG